MKKTAMLLICVLATSATCAADMKDYESLKKTDIFRYWLKGVSDGYMTANGFLAGDREHPLFCSPRKLGINTDNAVDILYNYVRAHANMAEKLRTIPIEVVYLAALKDAFPCK